MPNKLGELPDIPLLIEVEPAYGCNLRCIMCHVPTHDNAKPVYLDVSVLEKSTEGIENCHIILGSEYEPTIHPEFNQLLKLIIKRKWKVDFLSNGVNLDKVDLALWADVAFNVYNASFDGAFEESFSRIRVGADYHKVKQNIKVAAEIARNSGAKTAINATMLRSNLRETADLVKMWNDEGFDLVRLLVLQARATTEEIFGESLYPVRPELIATFNNVAQMIADDNLSIGVRSGFYGSQDYIAPTGTYVHQATVYSKAAEHRYVPGVRQDFQAGPWPGMPVQCRSPFVYCRIRWDGNVDLCNSRSRVIGNIYENSLHDIWHGELANSARRNILSSSTTCEKCDYFRFCIQSRQQDYTSKDSYFASGLLGTPSVVSFVEKVDQAGLGAFAN